MVILLDESEATCRRLTFVLLLPHILGSAQQGDRHCALYPLRKEKQNVLVHKATAKTRKSRKTGKSLTTHDTRREKFGSEKNYRPVQPNQKDYIGPLRWNANFSHQVSPAALDRDDTIMHQDQREDGKTLPMGIVHIPVYVRQQPVRPGAGGVLCTTSRSFLVQDLPPDHPYVRLPSTPGGGLPR